MHHSHGETQRVEKYFPRRNLPGQCCRTGNYKRVRIQSCLLGDVHTTSNTTELRKDISQNEQLLKIILFLIDLLSAVKILHIDKNLAAKIYIMQTL